LKKGSLYEQLKGTTWQYTVYYECPLSRRICWVFCACGWQEMMKEMVIGYRTLCVVCVVGPNEIFWGFRALWAHVNNTQYNVSRTAEYRIYH